MSDWLSVASSLLSWLVRFDSPLTIIADIIIVVGPVYTLSKRFWSFWKRPKVNVMIELRNNQTCWIIRNAKGKKRAKKLQLLVRFWAPPRSSSQLMFYGVNLADTDEISLALSIHTGQQHAAGFTLNVGISPGVDRSSYPRDVYDMSAMPFVSGKFELTFSGRNLRSSDAKPRDYNLTVRAPNDFDLKPVTEQRGMLSWFGKIFAQNHSDGFGNRVK